MLHIGINTYTIMLYTKTVYTVAEIRTGGWEGGGDRPPTFMMKGAQPQLFEVHDHHNPSHFTYGILYNTSILVAHPKVLISRLHGTALLTR